MKTIKKEGNTKKNQYLYPTSVPLKWDELNN